MWLVTIESGDDGMWWDDPMGFQSESEAREYTAKLGEPAPGLCFVLYRCDQAAVLAETPFKTAERVP